MTDRYFAAIDLGTNSCRLLIANQNGKPVYQDSIPTRLGEGLQSKMQLTPEAIARGVDCFIQYKQIMDRYDIVKLRAIATESCRAAKNARDFLQHVYEKTGIHIEVVDAKEEARLNLKGAISHVRKGKPYVAIVDLGGGSTEITLATNTDNPEMISTVSIPWGSITASDAFKLETYNEGNANRLRAEVDRWVNGFKHTANYGDLRNDVSFVATSSTPLRLAAIAKKHKVYDREKCDGLKFKTQDIGKILDGLKTQSVADMAANPCIGVKRSTMFVAATVMFKEIFDGLEADEITASLKSAKDGIVEELIEKHKAEEAKRNGKVNQIGKGSAWQKDSGR